MKTRNVLVVMALVFCLAFPLFAQGTAETAQKQEIRVLLANHPYGELLKTKIPEFEAKTGIKVNYESLQESQLTNKLTTEFATNSSSADVFMTRPLQEGKMFYKNGWYEGLDSYNFADYPANSVDIGRKDGTAYIVPLVTEWQVLYYRKDLFKQAGLSVPTNFTELEAAAKALNKDGVAGFASRGKGAAAVTQLSSYVYNFGGRYLDGGKAVFDSPEALEAIRYYGRLLGNYGPPRPRFLLPTSVSPSFPEARRTIVRSSSYLGAWRCPLLPRTRMRQSSSSTGRPARNLPSKACFPTSPWPGILHGLMLKSERS
jgi:multiple sugar transport system substrate-binding protein